MDGISKEQAIVFIDGNNLYKGLRDCYGIERLDLEPFCKYLIQDRQLAGIIYADANFIRRLGSNNYDCQQRYFSHIRKIQKLTFCKGYFNVRTRPPTEKLADVALASYMVDLCHREMFDIAYLVSGDNDLSPAVDIVVREGKRVFNVYFDTTKRNSYGLRRHCQGYFKNITQTIAKKFEWIPPVK
ncbi:MAG: NYN domain-containing protein [Candidatus Omnitrophica bacterium]|nr:NYN domain-containing protein [Candidatus Omnitrophota bacterium]MBU4479338.1 NYN domain-containing protein [Candidatus Omnitrophota bacterium]MCG2704224.1 NYN domain-containing protein [Candidatus Omnitrophota bacterium]